MRRLIPLLALIAAGCSGGGSPSAPAPNNPTPPPAQSFTLSGRVSETVPTASTRIPGALLTIADGPHAGRTATADGNGEYSFGALTPAGFTVRATAPGYLEASRGVNLTSSLTENFELLPVPQTVTTTRDESVSGGDPCSGGPDTFGDGCKQYALNLHHSGTIHAVVTWQDSDTWLWLELYRAGTDSLIARASSSRIFGLRQELSTNASGRAQYIIRVRYALGARTTPFSLTVTRPN